MSNFAVQKAKYQVKMRILEQYKIQFSGLNIGLHHFDFEIDDTFFELTASPDVKSGKLSVSVDLDKQETMMIFRINIKGTVELICDRCLDTFDHPLEIEEKLIVKQVVEVKESEDDTLMYIDMQEHTLDFSHILYEYISVSIPIQHIHPEIEPGVSGCDPEMIKKLEDFSKPQFNSQWDALKGLTTEDNN